MPARPSGTRGVAKRCKFACTQCHRKSVKICLFGNIIMELVVNLLPGCSSDRPLRDEDVEDVTRLALGSVLGGGGAFPNPNTPEAWCEQADALQRAACATQAGVPLLIGNDTVHGQVHLEGATLFPHHIGLGCTRDAELVERLAVLAARESAACGINWVFAPCATVPRDLRWGRTYEGFSEDPAIVATLGAAEVAQRVRAALQELMRRHMATAA